MLNNNNILNLQMRNLQEAILVVEVAVEATVVLEANLRLNL